MKCRAALVAGACTFVLLVGACIGSADGEGVKLPEENHAILDPIAAVEEGETKDASEQAALEAAADAAREMEETEKKPAPDVTPQEAKAEQFDGRNPHETQMDDLFGDMRREQAKEEEKEEMTLSNNARFAAKSPSNTADQRLGETDDDAPSLNKPDETDLGEGSGAKAGAVAGVAAPAPVNLLASPEELIKPGVDELQSYSTGHVTEQIQVGSANGILADAAGHNLAKRGSKVPKGRVGLFGKKAGVYLDDGESTWEMFSDRDAESGGVCLMTSYNRELKGIKVCHTSKASGMWASGNVGVTGNLLLEGKDAIVDVQRLHLHQTNVDHNGYVLKIGGGGPELAAGVSAKSAWLQVNGGKALSLNPDKKGNVGFGTENPQDKMHVAGTMAVNKVYVGHDKPLLEENSFTMKSGAGWEMTDKTWMRVLGNRGVEAQAGAYFTQNVGVNFNWKGQKAGAKLRINDGKIAVTRKFGKAIKGVAYFYDDNLGEGRVYARDFSKTGKKKWYPMSWEAEAIIFNPDGKSPILIGTRTGKDKYIVHIEGNNKVDGHIYVAKKMKVGGKAHVANMHTPRLNVKDDRGLDGNGQPPADGVKEFVVGEWTMGGTTKLPVYEMKPGGTNLRLGYFKDYCWMQMWPKGKGGSPLVLNGAGNAVGFGTTRPLTNIPGSGSSLKFHVDGNMRVDGNFIVKGEIGTSEELATEELLDVSSDDSAHMLKHLNARKAKEMPATFGDSDMHDGAISLSHVAATLTQQLKHHEDTLAKQEEALAQHDHRLSKIDVGLRSM